MCQCVTCKITWRFPLRSRLVLAFLLLGAASACKTVDPEASQTESAGAATAYAYSPCSSVICKQPGEKIPTEDLVIPNFHTVGGSGQKLVFRSASPVRDLVKAKTQTPDNDATMAAAAQRMADLKSHGIKAIVSFEDPMTDSATEPNEPLAASDADNLNYKSAVGRSVAVELLAAQKAGIEFLSKPMGNAGPNSLETMSDAEVKAWLEDATDAIIAAKGNGGVEFHCAEGHDRTGLVGAYLRIKYDGWSADDAINEMRQMGHDWKAFSKNGGKSSWHEDHLRNIAASMNGGGQ